MRTNCGGTRLDESLVDRMQRGDALALAMFATRHWNVVQRFGANMLPSASEAAELTEATFLLASRSPESFPPGVPLKTSLYRLAMSQALARLHSFPSSVDGPLAAFLPGFDDEGSLASPGADWTELGESAFGHDVGDRIREALQQLDVIDRAVFVLHVVEQLSAEQAAAVLWISPASVRQRAHRASLALTGFLAHLVERSSQEQDSSLTPLRRAVD